MKKRIMKSLLAMFVIIAMLSVTACNRDNKNGNNTEEDGSNTGDNTPGDNTTEDNVGTPETDGTITDKYNTLLTGDPQREDVYGFIDENITNANEDEADQLVYGVIGYEDTYENVDYKRLYAYKNYVSDEAEDFIELMYENNQKPYMDDNQINVTLDELLDRAEDFEKHITEFPDGVTTQPSYEMYTNLMNAAITGGYDKENNVASFYKGDADNRIDGRAIDEYMKFLADEVNDGDEDKVSTNSTTNSNSRTGNNTNTTGNSNTGNNTDTNTTNDTTNTTSNKANKNTNSDSAANIEANTTNGVNNTNGNSRTSTNNTSNNTANGTSTNNNTTTNNNTANNTTANSRTSNNTTNVTGDTANIGDNSETNFTAPITRSIVQDYVDLLVKTKNEITTEVETFYTNLPTLISEKFDL